MSSEYVEILNFKAFYKHSYFETNGENGRKKVIKNHINVSVGIDLEYGNTKE
ncbi:hypothetical protein OSO01_14580 [Oceanobacillus sojae]|uniref:Uncharacterized protein n=1 Tax=Oceanobacillus sojae TaxID=582851 RepID=A0A511ZGZ6_9BACI|nr:hypothetical protein OSO01_14580 [Oceanobacillus sojae]